MRAFSLIVILALAGSCFGQSRMQVKVRDKAVGFATVSQRLMPDGTKTVELRMELGTGKDKVGVRSESRFDASGAPIRKFQQTTSPKGEVKQTVITFNAGGANAVLLDGGKRTVRQIDLVETASRAASNEFWFLRDKPKVGDKVEAYEFNLDSLQWELFRAEYRGTKKITIGKKAFEAHEVLSERAGKQTTAYLDVTGLPLMIVSGEVSMVRLGDK